MDGCVPHIYNKYECEEEEKKRKEICLNIFIMVRSNQVKSFVYVDREGSHEGCDAQCICFVLFCCFVFCKAVCMQSYKSTGRREKRKKKEIIIIIKQ